jgi:lipopolysaccharide export system protein LptC
VTAKRQRLQIEGRRRQATIGAAHTWFVRVTKLVLPLAALVIVAIVVARLTQDPQQLQIAAIPEKEKTTPGEIDLVEARYEGVDEQNRPYTISADHARRVMGEEQTVALENPKGKITLEDGGTVTVDAAAGIFDNTASKLHLSGGVTVSHSSGYAMKLREVDVDVKTRYAKSAFPVQAEGPRGRLWAQDMEISDGGLLIVFGGPARLTLENQRPAKEKKG